MPTLHPAAIDSWHAHVYFDAATRDAAWALRERVARELAGCFEMGRFHEQPVGPHPMWSYQLAFGPGQLATMVSWLCLNHEGHRQDQGTDGQARRLILC